jgi:hypothetical protein
MTSSQGAPAGHADNVEQTELALHPDPHLAARNRIQPTQANPKGYPPFELRQMPSYTNNQLRYYLTRGQVTDMSAFTKAQRLREDLNRSVGLRGDTDDEDELGRFDHSRDAPTDQGSVTVNTATRTLTFDNDSESDDQFQIPVPGENGVRVEKITILSQDGGIVNYRTWLTELDRAFNSDRSRFNTAYKRITLATSYMDDSLKAQWSSASQTRPHIGSHWKKFLRWVNQNHLHGTTDRVKAIEDLHQAVQEDDETPAAFYSRLSLLATTIDQEVTQDAYLARLNAGLRATLNRTGRLGSNLEELITNAQAVWGSFKGRIKKRGRVEIQDTARKVPCLQQTWQRQTTTLTVPNNGSRPPMSEEERKRRMDNRLCLNCGKPNHIARKCRSTYNPYPTPALSSAPSTFTTAKTQQVTIQGRRSNQNNNQNRRSAPTRVNFQEARVQEVDDNDEYFDAEPQS